MGLLNNTKGRSMVPAGDVVDFAYEVLEDDSTFHHEDALDDAFTRQVTEGRQRLARPPLQEFITGGMGGVEIGLGVLLGMAVTQASGSQMVGGLAFSLGFVVLLLAHSELFTEGFLIPIFAVLARRARVWQLLRFWALTFVGNIVGGVMVMGVTVVSYPSLLGTLRQFGTHFANLHPTPQTMLLALLAGVAITLMTRMQMGTNQVVGKLAAAVFGGMLLFGVGMLHSVLDTLIMIAAWFAGAPEVSLGGIVLFWCWVIPLNMAGGVLLVALPRALQSRDRFRIERLKVVRELYVGEELADDARGALITGKEVREQLEDLVKDQQVEEEEKKLPSKWREWRGRVSNAVRSWNVGRGAGRWVAEPPVVPGLSGGAAPGGVTPEVADQQEALRAALLQRRLEQQARREEEWERRRQLEEVRHQQYMERKQAEREERAARDGARQARREAKLADRKDKRHSEQEHKQAKIQAELKEKQAKIQAELKEKQSKIQAETAEKVAKRRADQ